MNERELLADWNKAKPMYNAWGEFVRDKIKNNLCALGHDPEVFLKQPANVRIKSDDSLVDKAFYRIDKSYDVPFENIEDKVGVRFVVLLTDHVDSICNVIREENDIWVCVVCRDYEVEREKEPLLFTYQSVHFVLRSKSQFDIGNITILANTPCEIQIRTLLQHAYAELTHEALYKSKKMVQPKVHRKVARSMALIETTDDFFSEVDNSVNRTLVDGVDFQKFLDQLYFKLFKKEPVKAQKSSLVIIDEFVDCLPKDISETLSTFFEQNQGIAAMLNKNVNERSFYNQSVMLFVIWLIKKRTRSITNFWPLDAKILEELATDVGVSLNS
jgi:ppGpp synthetase/RelA/SpoT-type nucleotidyltranferase